MAKEVDDLVKEALENISLSDKDELFDLIQGKKDAES